MLELQNIDQADLSGFLLVNFPDYMPLDECRERLEYEIMQVYDADCVESGIPEEQSSRPAPAISPMWLLRVLHARRDRAVAALPPPAAKSYLQAVGKAWRDHRAKNFPAIKAHQISPIPQNLPEPSAFAGAGRKHQGQ